jgi:hypothetical protein
MREPTWPKYDCGVLTRVVMGIIQGSDSEVIKELMATEPFKPLHDNTQLRDLFGAVLVAWHRIQIIEIQGIRSRMAKRKEPEIPQALLSEYEAAWRKYEMLRRLSCYDNETLALPKKHIKVSLARLGS